MADKATIDLARALVSPAPKSPERGDPALLGYTTGSYTIAVLGAPGKVWVRPQSAGTSRTAVQALNTAGVQLLPDLPVLIKQIGSAVQIVGVNTPLIRNRLPTASAEPGSGSITPVSDRRVVPGLVHAQKDPLTGDPDDPATWTYSLRVYMEAYSYRWDGVDKYWPGGWVDLSSAVPATSNYQCWAKVCLNPATNTTVVSRSTEKPLLSLTRADLDGVDAASYTPHAGVKLTYGQTKVEDERTFEDIRPWWAGIGASPLSSGESWAVDAAPVTPAAQDDEFDDGSLAAKWTEYDPETIQTVSEAGENLTLSQPTQTAAYLTGLYQVKPANTFTYAIKVRFSHSLTSVSGQKIYGGIGVWQDGADEGDPALICGFGSHDEATLYPTAYSGFGYTQFTDHDTLAAETATGGFDEDTWYYLRLRSNGTVFYLDWSTDGMTWTALNMTTALSGLSGIGHIGLAMTNKDLGAAFEVEVDFFRYRNAYDNAADPVYGQSVDARLFTGLLDAPKEYTGAGGQLVAVKPGETGLEFIDPPPTLTVEEADGVPSIAGVTKIRVSNDTLVDGGDGLAIITTGGGGGGGSSAHVGVHAQRTTSQTVTAGVWVAVALTSADVYDTDSFHDPAANPSRMTIPAGKSGYYDLFGRVSFQTGSTFDCVGFMKNASGTVVWSQQISGTAAYGLSLQAAGRMYLAAGDYVELCVWQNKSGGMDIQSAEFSIALAGT